jgi:hypothetical protein
MRISWLLVWGLLFTACSKDEIYEPQWGPTIQTPNSSTSTKPQSNITIELDGRLPKDGNGYYHLILNKSTNQTIHRVEGKVLNVVEPTKVEWESNLFWWLKPGEVVANTTKTYINQFTGELTYVNLPPITNWKEQLVPTTNCCSYVDSKNEINTIIAPIYKMVGDTLVLTTSIKEKKITKSIKIILE